MVDRAGEADAMSVCSSPEVSDHRHDDFVVADDPGEMYGVTGTVDMRPVGTLVGATYDDCEHCADQALDAMSDNPAQVRRVMELAYVFTQHFMGRIPDVMVSDCATVTQQGPEFRAMMRAGMEQKKRAYPTIVDMSRAARRAAAHDAAKVIMSFMPKAQSPQDEHANTHVSGAPTCEDGDPRHHVHHDGPPDDVKATDKFYEVTVPDGQQRDVKPRRSHLSG